MERLSELYTDLYGHSPERIDRIAPEGSSRSYYRLVGEPTVVGCMGQDLEENRAFLALAGHLEAAGVPVPKVIGRTADASAYLLEDLGDTSLLDVIRRDGEDTPLLDEAIRELARLQYKGGRELDYGVCYPSQAMDRRMVQWDLNYFKYCFLKPCGIEFNEARLQDDFDRLASTLLHGQNEWAEPTLMHRDYQTRNLMVGADGHLHFIDFQGARRGPAEYDVASLLWQARAGLSDSRRKRLVEIYLTEAARYTEIAPAAFRERLRLFVLFRMLQVLGAYGFRGLIERKSRFLESVPQALATVRGLIDEGVTADYPELRRALTALCALPRFAPQTAAKGLTVTVMSFSYRRGIPYDLSGNGGGYVFDCRAIHNPGRYEPYKHLTGRDEPVKKFLEDDGEIFTFLSHVYALTDASVERYLKRGFNNLMVCFGCTGGRHRSVYSAEATARHIAERFPSVTVRLIHREQSIECTL